VLTAGLRELATEEPDLAPLILGCLDSEGLHQENMDTVWKVAFHALDYALNALFELRPNNTIAYHAAYAFCSAGAGVRPLSSWIEATGDGELPLVTAVGSSTLKPSLIPTAIRLLTSCNPPNNHALYSFINHNAEQLDGMQRRSVIRLITWPVRRDTGRLGDVLGWVAFKEFPDSTEIQQMWTRWIRDGVYDGKPSSPMRLARYLADAHKEGLAGWEAVNEALRDYVRKCLRSGDKDRVDVAINHVRAAADAGAPVLAELLREAEGAVGTAEWNEWRERDPDASEWMRCWVSEVAKEATGDRDWLRALNSAKESLASVKELQRILEKDEHEPNGDG
jgi:hypothetical protein